MTPWRRLPLKLPLTPAEYETDMTDTKPRSIDELLACMIEADASDLHLAVGSPAVMRVRGHIERIPNETPLSPEDVRDLIYGILNTAQQKTLEAERQLDFAYAVPGLARFRVNAYFQRASVGAAFRLIPARIRTLEELKMPERLYELCEKPRGLVLVTGPTGSGKTTTLASLLDLANSTRRDHIVTIEDPIEFLHWHRQCIVNQREIGTDATTFASGLRAALRQDPDVILVGEMRDLETIRLALTAAETGHLVFGTLHTSSAAKTIDRVVDVFPGEEKDMVRSMLSESLRAVISQTLLKKVGGGRIAAHEIMIGSPAIRNLIREGKIAQMYSAIQTGQAQGMQTLDQCLTELVSKNLVTKEEARYKAQNKDAL
jgi:twitching motility protein PilT